jgi:hypothetical protein
MTRHYLPLPAEALVILDFGALLAPGERSDQLTVAEALREPIAALAAARPTAVLTPLPAPFAAQLLGLPAVEYFGARGAQHVCGGELLEAEAAPVWRAAISELHRWVTGSGLLDGTVTGHAGLVLELRWQASVPQAMRDELASRMYDEARFRSLVICERPGVTEIRPTAFSRAQTVERLLVEHGPTSVLYVADDGDDGEVHAKLGRWRDASPTREVVTARRADAPPETGPAPAWPRVDDVRYEYADSGSPARLLDAALPHTGGAA